MMQVKLAMDPKLVWKLTDDAEKSGMNLSEYITFLVTLKAPAEKPKRLSERQKQIIELHGEGFTDEEIAARLECVRGYVTQIRRRFDLAPNKRRKAA